jgi:hypothetical protein
MRSLRRRHEDLPERQLRQQLKESGERVPVARKGRLPKGQVQAPLNYVDDPSKQYVPWDDRDFTAKPLPGFDPLAFPGPFNITAKIDTYLDAQAEQQQKRCFLCGIEIRKVFTGGNSERRTYKAARLRMPRGGHTQVRIADEVFCEDCADWIERSNPNPAVHIRLAEVLAHYNHTRETNTPTAYIADPSEQTRILTEHNFIQLPE